MDNCKTQDQSRYKDLVCGMSTKDKDDFEGYEYEGKFYYFCSKHCLKKFQQEPQKYIGKATH